MNGLLVILDYGSLITFFYFEVCGVYVCVLFDTESRYIVENSVVVVHSQHNSKMVIDPPIYYYYYYLPINAHTSKKKVPQMVAYKMVSHHTNRYPFLMFVYEHTTNPIAIDGNVIEKQKHGLKKQLCMQRAIRFFFLMWKSFC